MRVFASCLSSNQKKQRDFFESSEFSEETAKRAKAIAANTEVFLKLLMGNLEQSIQETQKPQSCYDVRTPGSESSKSHYKSFNQCKSMMAEPKTVGFGRMMATEIIRVFPPGATTSQDLDEMSFDGPFSQNSLEFSINEEYKESEEDQLDQREESSDNPNEVTLRDFDIPEDIHQLVRPVSPRIPSSSDSAAKSKLINVLFNNLTSGLRSKP